MKNVQNKDEISPYVLDSIFDIMNKCGKFCDRNEPLMGKALDLANLLFSNNLKPRVDSLYLLNQWIMILINLVESMYI